MRAKRLKSKKISSSIREKIEHLPGVLEVRTNPGAGSIVVNYDTHVVDATVLEDQIEAICSPNASGNGENGNGLAKQLNRATKVGMMTTLATSITYGFLGKKKPHIAYGTAFLAFAGLHMLKHSSRLLR
ncbi:MAG: hypothetical protein MI754_00945 [Chromatiales bacterium]|nr:hypothetical protein [Chromatiales bacterium]